MIASMITDQIGQHEVLLPINHKNYNFREKNSQVMKERENLHQNTYKGDEKPSTGKQAPKTQKQACARTHVITTLIVID